MTLQRLKNNFLQHGVALTKITNLSRRASLAFVFTLGLGTLQIYAPVEISAQGSPTNNTWVATPAAGHAVQNQVFPGAGNRTLTRNLTVTYTWTSNDGTPAPQSVVLKKVKGGSASGMYGGMMCTNIVLPNPTPQYEVRAVTGNTVTVTESVTTTATTPSAGGMLAVTLNVKLAYPKLTLNGTTTVSGTDYILIGQGCQAVLSLQGDSIPEVTLDPNGYNWTVSGDKFDTFLISSNASIGHKLSCQEADTDYLGIFNDRFKTSSPKWIWASPSSASITGSDNVYVNNVNIGQISSNKSVIVEEPSNIYMLGLRGRHRIDPVVPELTSGDPAYSPTAQGFEYRGSLLTPQKYLGVIQSVWCVAQVVTPSMYARNTTTGIYKQMTFQGQRGLDTSFPYQSNYPNAGNPYSPLYDPNGNYYPCNGVEQMGGDTPGSGTLEDNFNRYEIGHSFEVYMMYMPPDTGAGRSWVNVKSGAWEWNANANRVGVHWQGTPTPVHTLSGAGVTGGGTFSSSYAHPEWGIRVTAAWSSLLP
jgi:hypothetical protein